MTLFFTLLPLYLFGNIHCLGMCGPLVMIIGQHPFRWFYFVGRTISYTLAGLFAGEAGAILYFTLKRYYLSEGLSLICGMAMIGWSLKTLFYQKTMQARPSKLISKLNHKLSLLLLKNSAASTFLFGFFTVFLPCGQTVVVFSACALSGSAWVGAFNGFALALLTSPSLFAAMQAPFLFKKWKGYSHIVLAYCMCAVGLLTFCRGLAEMGWISHFILNPNASSLYHIVVF